MLDTTHSLTHSLTHSQLYHSLSHQTAVSHQAAEWMNEWLQLEWHYHRQTVAGALNKSYTFSRVLVISVNGSSLVQSFQWGLQQYCFEVVPECIQWRHSPDAWQQRVPRTCRAPLERISCCALAGWWHSKCRRAGRSKLLIISVWHCTDCSQYIQIFIVLMVELVSSNLVALCQMV